VKVVDTSIFIDFAVDEALADIARRARLAPGSVRRVAIVGPGLDFADKQQGYDFYPEQTLQPFAVIDALVGLGLSSESDLTLTVFDLSPRVLAHLETAAAAAQAGHLYRLVLPRSLDRPWSLGLASYWQRFGSHIGAPIAAPAPPPGAGRLEVRGVGVRPAIAAGIATRRLNIVLERPPSAEDGGRFDLVVVTNLLLYYDVFEQSLALENIAAMLRPGGLLLSNNRAIELPNAGLRSVGTTSVVYMTLAGIGEAGDQIVWYAR